MSVSHSIADTVQQTTASLKLFGPELALCGTILLVLLLQLFGTTRRLPSWLITAAGLAVALWLSLAGTLPAGTPATGGEIFSGLVRVDSWTTFFRCLFFGFGLLFVALTRITRLVELEGGADFCGLLLGAILGFSLMASANHLLMVFLAVEMASVPSYVLAGIVKGRRHSSEASLKYAIYGAGAAGVMLYGISLLAGLTGTLHLPSIAAWLDSTALDPQTTTVLSLAGLMILVGLAFKLSAVPFHFWCPDVFEGATAEIDALLSVASKAAALALLVRVTTALAGITGDGSGAATERLATTRSPIVHNASLDERPLSDVSPPIVRPAADRPSADSEARPSAAASLMGRYIVLLLALLAAVTSTFGNLAAYGQTNIKRLLAYSTIAHAGYMIMPVAAAMALAGGGSATADLQGARSALAALAFYAAVYLFMNLTAFAVVAFLRHAGVREEIDEYAGLIRSHSVLVICFSLALISLIGIPPLAGFVGKFFIFAALADAGGPLMIGLMLIAGINTAISLIYYLRVIKVMTMQSEPDDRGPVVLSVVPVTYTLVIAVPLIVLGIFFSQLYVWAEKAASGMFL